MEKKKSLIIFKPMSPTLQKLHGVLEGIIVEENVEIIISDNLKEMHHLLSMGGQYLTLTSDVKICLTFLQENKATIVSSKSKVLLLTPKEIPFKILDKFFKLGLTENILDSLPPKTLLYKIKLLLKSIKVTDLNRENDDRHEVVVKSMIDTAEPSKTEKNKIGKQEKSEPLEEAPKRERKKDVQLDIEPGMDYLSTNKNKKTYQEENIDTSWKNSKPLSGEAGSTDSSGNGEMTGSFQTEEIDNYFRGKLAQHDNKEFEESDDTEKVKKLNSLEDENSKKKRKDSVELDIIDNSKNSQKGQLGNSDENEDNSSHLKLKTLGPLGPGPDEDDKEESPYKHNKLTEEEKKRKNYGSLLLTDKDDSADKGRRSNFKEEDLGGHMKGKLNTSLDLESDESDDSDEAKKRYEKEEKERKKPFELDIESSGDDKPKSAQASSEDGDEDKKNRIDLGPRDEIDDILRGKINNSGKEKNDHDRKSNNINLDLVDSDNDKRRNQDFESEDSEKPSWTNSLSVDEDDSEKAARDYLNKKESEEDKKKRSNLELDLIDNSKDDENKQDKDLENYEKDHSFLKGKISNEKEKNSKRNLLQLKQVAKDLEHKKLDLTELDLVDNENSKKQSGKTDQMDGFLRGKSLAKKEHDWDIHNKKNNQAHLDIEHTPEKEIKPDQNRRKETSEITIDYRKLRKEFNEISKPEYKSSIHYEKDESSNDEEEFYRFKVIEHKANGFDFAISIINQLYNSDVNPLIILKSVAEKILKEEQGFTVFYNFQNYNKQHNESFNSFNEFEKLYNEHWNNFSANASDLEFLFNKSMSTWICRQIKDRDTFWYDTELPSWAAQELRDKSVEFVYPYYDGLDRMGMAFIFFPFGIKTTSEKKLIILLELVRGVFLNSIQRERPEEIKKEVDKNDQSNKVLNLFGGLFSNKKAG